MLCMNHWFLDYVKAWTKSQSLISMGRCDISSRLLSSLTDRKRFIVLSNRSKLKNIRAVRLRSLTKLDRWAYESKMTGLKYVGSLSKWLVEEEEHHWVAMDGNLPVAVYGLALYLSSKELTNLTMHWPRLRQALEEVLHVHRLLCIQHVMPYHTYCLICILSKGQYDSLGEETVSQYLIVYGGPCTWDPQIIALEAMEHTGL